MDSSRDPHDLRNVRAPHDLRTARASREVGDLRDLRDPLNPREQDDDVNFDKMVSPNRGRPLVSSIVSNLGELVQRSSRYQEKNKEETSVDTSGKPSLSTAATVASVSRRMKLLAMRKEGFDTDSAMSKERKRKLEEMKEKERNAEFASARLEARVQILDMFIQRSLVDDELLGRKEINPWRFKRKDGLNRRWRFVNDVVTTQELIGVIRDARARKEQEEKGLAESSTGSGSSANDSRVATPSHTGVISGSREKDVIQEQQSPDNEIEKEAETTDGADLSKRGLMESCNGHPQSTGINNENGKATLFASRKRTSGKTSIRRTGVDNVTDITHDSGNAKPQKKIVPRRLKNTLSEDKNKHRGGNDDPNNHNHHQQQQQQQHDGQPVYAFGSYHRKDKCSYCSSETNRQKFPDSPKKSGGAISPEILERVVDMNEIYHQRTRHHSFRHKLEERIEQIEGSMRSVFHDVDDKTMRPISREEVEKCVMNRLQCRSQRSLSSAKDAAS